MVVTIETILDRGSRLIDVRNGLFPRSPSEIVDDLAAEDRDQPCPVRRSALESILGFECGEKRLLDEFLRGIRPLDALHRIPIHRVGVLANPAIEVIR